MEAAVCGGTAAVRSPMGGTGWPVDGRQARVVAAAEEARESPELWLPFSGGQRWGVWEERWGGVICSDCLARDCKVG